MVKVHKMFCIDADIADKLKEVNGSGLINQLLSEHFGTTRENINKKRATITKQLTILNAEEKEYEEIEYENNKLAELQARKDEIRAERKKEYEVKHKALDTQCRKKEITFEEFMTLSKELKRELGI